MKRFMDTSLWEKAWFQDLSPAEKCAWMYVLNSCDNVGVWSPNFKLADFIIGEQVDWEALPGKVNNNLHVMENGKWFVVDFCSFQHPDLNPESTSKPIQSYIRELKKHGLWDDTQGYPKGIHTLSIGYKERERERDKERVKARKNSEPKKRDETETWTEAEFRAVYPFTDFPKERRHIKYLVAKARSDPGKDEREVLSAMLAAYRHLIENGDEFWRKQPFTPSALNSLWDRVIAAMRERPKAVIATDAAREFLERKYGATS